MNEENRYIWAKRLAKVVESTQSLECMQMFGMEMFRHSILTALYFEVLFGPEYTKRFQDIVTARVHIKHKDFDKASEMFEGALKPYLNEEQYSKLAYALKIVINSVYGMTAAKFENVFRDPRNIDNIVAKRGALFMTLLKHEVQKMGYKVCHIKTDSIKIPKHVQNPQVAKIDAARRNAIAISIKTINIA